MQVSSYIKTMSYALFSFFLVITIISFPKQAFESSLRGLTIWWEVVFPALLPFFITAELLMGFGVVHFLGVLLEPLMRPLFRVPGVGAFALSMGLASGYPMGAKLTVKLREQKLVSRSEGERLLCITSTSGPLFMIGAVAVGFFHDVQLGIILAASHYCSALCLGLLMRFYKPENTQSSASIETLVAMNATLKKDVLLVRALKAMHLARMQNGKPIGTLMKEAVQSSIQTLLLIGGFIIMFSVMTNILQLVGITYLIGIVISAFFTLFGLPESLVPGLITGVFEITLGSQMTSDTPVSIPLVYKAAIAGAIIAWSGFSVHAQVASMISQTDIRYTPYLFARMAHAILAFVWTFILWKPVSALLPSLDTETFADPTHLAHHLADYSYLYLSYTLMMIFSILFMISILIWFAQRKKTAAQKQL